MAFIFAIAGPSSKFITVLIRLLFKWFYKANLKGRCNVVKGGQKKNPRHRGRDLLTINIHLNMKYGTKN
jgi:hypothetical protein